MPLIDSPKIDEKIRLLFRETFPEVIYELQHQPQLFLPTVPPPGQQLIIVQQGLSGTTTTTVSQASVIQV